MRPSHCFFISQAFSFDLRIECFFPLLCPLLFLLFIELSLRICPPIRLLPSCFLSLDLRLQESPPLRCYFERILSGQLLLILESAPFFCTKVGLEKCLFLESGPLECCSLACLLGPGPGSPQNIILVMFLSIGLCLDAGTNDRLISGTTGGQFSLNPRPSQRIFSLKDGDVSRIGEDLPVVGKHNIAK